MPTPRQTLEQCSGGWCLAADVDVPSEQFLGLASLGDLAPLAVAIVLLSRERGGPGWPGLVLSYATVFFGSTVFSWVYNRTEGSLLIAVLLHAGVHLNNPFHAVPADIKPLAVYTCAITIAAVAVILFDRGAWRRDLARSGEPMNGSGSTMARGARPS